MAEKTWENIKKALDRNEEIFRVYRAFEGDMRIVTINRITDEEKRYTVNEETNEVILMP